MFLPFCNIRLAAMFSSEEEADFEYFERLVFDALVARSLDAESVEPLVGLRLILELFSLFLARLLPFVMQLVIVVVAVPLFIES
jgi:hypothetical protein